MIEITNTILPSNLIIKAIRAAQLIAIRNRCTYFDKTILCVSGDEHIIQKHMGISAEVNADMNLGCCFLRGGYRGIYLRPNESRYNTVKTLCHELAHAFTNPNVKHGYSWRSLYFLYWATLPRIFDIYEMENDFYDEVVHTLSRYELRGVTPYERHVNAMLRMRRWYVSRFEGEKTS